MKQANTEKAITVNRTVKIGKTLYNVTSVYKGEQELRKVLFDWETLR